MIVVKRYRTNSIRIATQNERKFAYLIIRLDYTEVARTIPYICVQAVPSGIVGLLRKTRSELGQKR